ncbi:MAG: isoamylase early set domain-containing protein [Gemmatimonadaceae bacterium]
MHDQRDPIESIARELRRPVQVSVSLDDRIMGEVRQLPHYGRLKLWLRLTTPRTITITPLRVGLAAAALAMFAILGAAHVGNDIWRVATPIATAMFPSIKKPAPNQRVQFVLVAPDAKKVSVVGDFNGWDVAHAGYQAQHRGGGVWSVTAPVPVGHHRYSFVVDDSVWVADPTAPRVIDNDYGMPNSAIVVSEQQK